MPSATTSWQHSLERQSERQPREPSRTLSERDSERGLGSSSGVPNSEQTWAAGDKRTQVLMLMLTITFLCAQLVKNAMQKR